ncbi:hypothetical protein AGMMS50212_04090 [Spirochaetia bacterium]|nr:hypothetical protein AGMMS50212_04090 [Spirochaetia bacterium]
MKKYFSALLTVLFFASFVLASCDSGGSSESPKGESTKSETLEGGNYSIDQFNKLFEVSDEVTIKGNATVFGQGAISITGKTLVLDANLTLSKSFPPSASPEFISETPLLLAGESEGEPEPDIIFVVLDGNIVKSDGAKIKAINGTKCYVAGVSKVDSNIFDSTSIPASYLIPAADDITQGGVIKDWTLSSTGPASGKTLFVSGILTIDNNSAIPGGIVRSLGKVSITSNTTGSLLKSEKLILDNAASISLSGSGNVDFGTRSINYLAIGSALPKLSGGSVTIVKGLTSEVSFTVGSEAALTLGTASNTTLNGNVIVNGILNVFSGAKGEGKATVTVKSGGVFNSLSVPIDGSDPWVMAKMVFEHESTVNSKLFVTSLGGVFSGTTSFPLETYDTINYTMLNSTGNNDALIQTTEGASLTLTPDNYHLVGNASVEKMFALSGGDTLKIDGGTLALAGTKSLYVLSGKIVGEGTSSTLNLSAGSSSIVVMPDGSDPSSGNPTFNFYDNGGTLLTREAATTVITGGIYKWTTIGGTLGWKAQE